MKRDFISYDKEYITKQGDNVQNIMFELVTRCISNGSRIIIEQKAQRGQAYIMVDFAPTDNSNSECPYDGQHVCFVTSVDNDDEGDVDESFTNYLDACRWLTDYVTNNDFHLMYNETY